MKVERLNFRWIQVKAYKEAKANRGAPGIDKQSISVFEMDLKNNLYQLWNRMASGSYFPAATRYVEIDKSDGGKRILGIPTVKDRIAQGVAKAYIEPRLEEVFHEDSYGYRPNRSAHDAIEKARKRCWKYDWVIDLDIKAFLDTIDHELLLKAVSMHVSEPWIILYIKRWLKAPMQNKDGQLIDREQGLPQGGVISPILANLFLHYAFDKWMVKNLPYAPFERYADDLLVHVETKKRAEEILEAIGQRMTQVKLELHPQKTKIVYCKDSNRKGEFEQIRFDFLGFTFAPRYARNKFKQQFNNFLPAASDKAVEEMGRELRRFRIHLQTGQTIAELARLYNPVILGWINYYGRFYKSRLGQLLRRINIYLIRWARKKYRRLSIRANAWKYLSQIAEREPNLWAHWSFGVIPKVGSLGAV
ncbi:group II intron reverse transcriptase/maturase [Acidithrix sp. C25]|uniref:group II intron reverse transcriptase/maturase n=2 Tax=Acidithrix sp. C25 TaxID=1671482 RepID=UPI00191BAFA0